MKLSDAWTPPIAAAAAAAGGGTEALGVVIGMFGLVTAPVPAAGAAVVVEGLADDKGGGILAETGSVIVLDDLHVFVV